MQSINPQHEPTAPPPQDGGASTSSLRAPEIDDGLRSTHGIRWLLLVGALVVAVSTVRLVVVQWGALASSLKALILVAGALAIFAIGDLTRHRLRLPAAGSALLFLFVGLVPLLAWGAAYRDLVHQPFGWVVVLLGFGALLAACQRLLRRVLRYSGRFYPAALGTLLLATPFLPSLQRQMGEQRDLFFLTVCITLGLLLRTASRHINRFFFHRDRRQGSAQPIHLLPFGLLALIYLLATGLLATALPGLALPLLFLGIALVDTGEEYLRACSSVEGKMLQPWPRRTRGLLSLGLSTMAVAGALAVAAAGPNTLALVLLLGGLRLFAWGWHYRRLVAYIIGLTAVLAAIPLLPDLTAGLGFTLFTTFGAWIVGILGPLADFALGQLAALGALIAVGTLLSRRGFPPRFQQAHNLLAAIHATGLLVMALFLEPMTAIWLAPAAGLLLFLGLIGTRHPSWLLGLYQSLLVTSYVGAQLFALDTALVIGGGSLLFLTIGLAARRPLKTWLGNDNQSWRYWLTLPPLATASALVLTAGAFLGVWSDFGTGNAVLLQVTGIVALAGLVLRNRAVLCTATLGLPLVTHLIAADVSSPLAFSLASHLPLLGFAFLARLARRRSPALVAPAATAGLGMSALLGLVWLVGALTVDALGMASPLLLSLGLILIDRDLLSPTQRSTNQWDGVGLGALVLFAVAQIAAAGWLTGAAALGLAAGAVLLLCAVLLRSAKLTRLLARSYGHRQSIPRLHRALDDCLLWWQGVAGVVCLAVSGPAAFLLALALTASVAWRTFRSRAADQGPTLAVALLPLVQVAALPAGTGYLLPELVAQGFSALPALALATLGWQIAAFLFERRRAAVPQGLVFAVNGTLAIGYLFATLGGASFGAAATALLFATALGNAALCLARSLARAETMGAWAAQGWLLLSFVQAIATGWLRWDGPALGWVLIGLATLDFALGAALERYGRSAAARSALLSGFALAALAAWVSLASTLGAHPTATLWLTLFPTFMASLVFLGLSRLPATNQARGGLPFAAALASMATFAAGLHVGLLALPSTDPALYCLGPGLALLGLSWQLRAPLGRRGSRALFTTGAGLLYAMPVLGLLDEISWGWQIVLLLLAVAFGAASFRLRSRSLLTVSTAALLINLGFFLLKLHSTVPIALWILGLIFGLGLMVLAAVLEHRRERLLQQLRVWGREIRAWA